MASFHEFVTAARIDAGLSRDHVTDELGWSKSYIFLIETGRRVPATAHLDRYFDVLLLGPKQRSDALRLAADALRTGRAPSEVSTPADAVQTPADEVSTPADAVQTPADEVSTPADAVQTPADEVSTPADAA